LVLVGGLTAALTAAVSAESDHLARVYAVASGESLFSGSAFLITGMVPLILSAVWFAVSVALGAAFRRTLPAIFTSVAAFFGLFFLVQWRFPTPWRRSPPQAPPANDRPARGPPAPTRGASPAPRAR